MMQIRPQMGGRLPPPLSAEKQSESGNVVQPEPNSVGTNALLNSAKHRQASQPNSGVLLLNIHSHHSKRPCRGTPQHVQAAPSPNHPTVLSSLQTLLWNRTRMVACWRGQKHRPSRSTRRVSSTISITRATRPDLPLSRTKTPSRDHWAVLKHWSKEGDSNVMFYSNGYLVLFDTEDARENLSDRALVPWKCWYLHEALAQRLQTKHPTILCSSLSKTRIPSCGVLYWWSSRGYRCCFGWVYGSFWHNSIIQTTLLNPYLC